MKLARLCAVLAVALIGLDAITTIRLLQLPHTYEADPIARSLFAALGYTNVLVGRTMLLSGAAIAALVLIVRSQHARLAWFGLALTCAAGFGASLNNVLLMKG